MHAFRFASLLLSLALVAGSASAAQKKPDPNKAKTPGAPAAPASDGTETVILPITGQMCNNCAVAVSTYFKKMDGVKDATADGAKTATVVFDPKKTTIEKLLEAFKGKDDRFKAYKPGETPPEPKYTYSGKPESISGKMTIRGTDSAKDVVARLIAHRSGEPTERIFNLIADSAIAEKIEAKRKEGVGSVTVTGVVSAEGIKVEKID